MKEIRRAFWYCGTAPPSALCRFDFSSFDKFTNSPREKQKFKIQNSRFKIVYFAFNKYALSVAGGGVRQKSHEPPRVYQNRRFCQIHFKCKRRFLGNRLTRWRPRLKIAPPHATACVSVLQHKDKEKLAKHALRRVNFELKLLTVWFDTIVNRQQN